MSTPNAPVIDPGLEYGALVSTRRWLIVIGTTVAYGTTVLIGLRLYPQLSAPEHLLLGLSAVLVVAGLLGSRRRPFLWILTVGIAVLLLTTVVAADGSPRWIPLNLLMGYVAYFVIMLSSRVVGLVAAPLMVVVMMSVWSQRPTNAIVANLATFGGWVAALQLLCSALFLWWSWNRLRQEAAVADRALAEAQQRTLESISAQERARLWRQTAVRLHESVLNTIRYVLTATSVDRDRLSQELAADRSMPAPTPAGVGTSIAALVEAVLHDAELAGHVRVTGWVPDVPIDPEVYEAVRAAAVELGRNSLRHGQATTVTISARSGLEGQMVLRMEDDGRPADAWAPPGVGTATVLDAALKEVGARWSRDVSARGGSVSRIVMPRQGENAAPKGGRRAFPPFDKGRLLVTSALAGIAVGGSVNFVKLAVSGGVAERIAAVLGLVGIVVSTYLVVKRRRIDQSYALVLVLAPAMVPWFLLGDQYTCAEGAPLSPLLNIAGYCVMIIAAWSGPVVGAVGLSVWAVSGGLLVLAIPAGCRDSVAIALVNSLVAVPVLLSVAYAGARAYTRAQEEAQATRQREITERSAAAAAIDINHQLDDAVNQAEQILARVVGGQPLDGDTRRSLEQLDGRIRAGIQVDPESDGAVAVLAKALVDEAADQGIRISVRAITCSHDPRPVPREVARLLYRVLVTPVRMAPRLQVFTDGEEDHLSVLTERPALRAAGLEPGALLDLGECVVEVDDGGDDDEGRYAILVSRPIAVDAPSVT